MKMARPQTYPREPSTLVLLLGILLVLTSCGMILWTLAGWAYGG